MAKYTWSASLLTAALALVFAGCNGGGHIGLPGPGATPQHYVQIELLARPAVKEAFEAFANHDVTNRIEPYGNQSTDPLFSSIGSFTDAFRAPQYGTTLQAVLYPNEMIADLSQAGPAAYLGVETGGATGGKFGGRALGDDVIDISLGAIFGNTLSALSLVADDHKEAPCLTTDNVGYDKANTATFPYIQAPL